jgi:hypothetical protein
MSIISCKNFEALGVLQFQGSAPGKGNYHVCFSLVHIAVLTPLCTGISRVVTRTITDGRTMAAGSSETWMHYSVRYEVTWGKKARIRADSPLRLRGHQHIRTDIGAFVRTRSSPCPRPPSVTPSLTLCGCAVVSARTRKIFFLIKIKLNIFFGCWLLEKRGKKCSVFGP